MNSLTKPAWTEEERLTALHRYAVVGTDVGGAFDDFVRIAAFVCDVPFAMVNLIDKDRQWFAAIVGADIRETPRDASICNQILRQPGVTVVPDLATDGRFALNPFVNGWPNLRFYGGALLETAEGLPLGTVCVLDTNPRPEGLTDRQKDTLQALARQVMTQLELRWTLARFAESEAHKDRLIAEKDLLLGEVHHRVKNSLSMVQSLLVLQAGATKEPGAVGPLRESAGRIRTIAAMHEQLYRFGAANEVDLADYLRGLMAEQHAALGSAFEGRSIGFSGEPVQWPAAEAPTVGLVAIELVTNALKYGQGAVSITLRTTAAGVDLRVEDEGPAPPPSFDPAASRGFGMRLIRGLLDGREGQMTLDRTQATTSFLVEFTRPDQTLPDHPM